MMALGILYTSIAFGIWTRIEVDRQEEVKASGEYAKGFRAGSQGEGPHNCPCCYSEERKHYWREGWARAKRAESIRKMVKS